MTAKTEPAAPTTPASPATPASEDADAVLRRADALLAQRRLWENHWQELADYVLPRRSDIVVARAQGDKHGEKLFDGTAPHANELLAAALHGMLTNPASRWFELGLVGVEESDLDGAARDWLQAATDALIDAFGESNLATQLHELYLDLGCFGTGCLYLDETDGRLRFSTRSLSEVAVAEDAFGRIDTVFRRFAFSARQAAQQFGTEALGPKPREALTRDPDRPFSFVHAVFPRADATGGTTVAGGRLPFASLYVCVDDRCVVSRGGYHEFPWMVPRWSKATAEVYGRSPAMGVLPDIKMLNEMARTTLKAAQKAVDPPLMMPDDGFVGQIRTAPGAVNYYRAGLLERIETLPFRGDVALGLQMEDRRRAPIRSAFFVDQLQLAEGPSMTATEVLQRTEEKLRMMGPMLGRLQNELLRPLIGRAFAILARAGRIPEAPKVLKRLGGRIEVDYVSPIARAQRGEEAGAMTRVAQAIQPFVAANPELLDLVDAERLLRHVAARFGVPRGIVRDDNAVARFRRDRRKAMEATMAAMTGGAMPGGPPPDGEPSDGPPRAAGPVPGPVSSGEPPGAGGATDPILAALTNGAMAPRRGSPRR